MTVHRWRGLVLLLGTLAGSVLSWCAAAPAYAHAGGLSPHDFRYVVTDVTPSGARVTVVNSDTQLLVRVADQVVRRTIRPPAAGRTRWRQAVPTPAGEVVVRGRVEWADGPSPVPWAVLVVAFAVTGYLLGRSRWWRSGLAVGGCAVTAANVLHAVGSALVVTDQALPLMVAGASGVGLVCWPLAVVGTVAAVRRRPSAAFVAATVGAALVVAGVPDLDSFRYSQLPFAWAYDLDRLLVAVTLGGGAGLAVGGFAAMRRYALAEPTT